MRPSFFKRSAICCRKPGTSDGRRPAQTLPDSALGAALRRSASVGPASRPTQHAVRHGKCSWLLAKQTTSAGWQSKGNGPVGACTWSNALQRPRMGRGSTRYLGSGPSLDLAASATLNWRNVLRLDRPGSAPRPSEVCVLAQLHHPRSLCPPLCFLHRRLSILNRCCLLSGFPSRCSCA